MAQSLNAVEHIVIDTDVWSFLYKNDTRANAYRPLLVGKEACLSFQSVAELYFWAETNKWGDHRRVELAEAIQAYVILTYDDQTAQIWAQIRAACQRAGRPLAPSDAWIAASAMQHGYGLLTHNIKHYEAINGLILLTHNV